MRDIFWKKALDLAMVEGILERRKGLALKEVLLLLKEMYTLRAWS